MRAETERQNDMCALQQMLPIGAAEWWTSAGILQQMTVRCLSMASASHITATGWAIARGGQSSSAWLGPAMIARWLCMSCVCDKPHKPHLPG